MKKEFIITYKDGYGEQKNCEEAESEFLASRQY
jgi:hypothetical protein